VIDITLVAIYSVISLFIVSIIGNEEIEPLKYLLFNLEHLSNREEWTLNILAGNASFNL